MTCNLEQIIESIANGLDYALKKLPNVETLHDRKKIIPVFQL